MIHFTPSETNKADICTKNVSLGLFEKHSKEIYNGKLVYDLDSNNELKDDTMPIEPEQIEGLPYMISREKNEVVMNTSEEIDSQVEEDNTSDYSIEIIYPEESSNLNLSNLCRERQKHDEEFIQRWNDQEIQLRENRKWIQNARRDLSASYAASGQLKGLITNVMKNKILDMDKIREHVNTMILTGRDYRIKKNFRRELKREIEFRNIRRLWDVEEIINTEYPSDDPEDSDYSLYEQTSDEEMVFSASHVDMTLDGDSEDTHTYEMTNQNEKINQIEERTKTILEKVNQLMAYSEDMEGLMNANIGDEEARNEVVDRHFLHVDMALAKQNQEIMYVRDKLFTEIMMLRNDVKRAGVNLIDRNLRESTRGLENQDRTT